MKKSTINTVKPKGYMVLALKKQTEVRLAMNENMTK